MPLNSTMPPSWSGLAARRCMRDVKRSLAEGRNGVANKAWPGKHKQKLTYFSEAEILVSDRILYFPLAKRKSVNF